MGQSREGVGREAPGRVITVFLDTSVILAAARSTTGGSSALFRLQKAGYLRLVTSPWCLEEAVRNVAPDEPASEHLRSLLQVVGTVPDGVSAFAWAGRHVSRTKDVPVLASAAAAGIQFLATLDVSDFGKVFERPDLPVFIATPGVLLKLLAAQAIRSR